MEVAYWPEIMKNSDFKVERNWVSSESGIKGSAFALKIDNANYLPEFRKGTVIVVDYTCTPKEGDFVLGLLTKNSTAELGRFVIEKGQNLLVSLSQERKELQIGKEVKLCGFIAEAKHSF